jgi:cysteine synthase
MLARRHGYQFLAVLPENVSIERRQLLEAPAQRSVHPASGARTGVGAPSN